ncbi:MAG: hypothetical protein Q7N87_03690 [Candidatus Uhrbacteria bacterium]|nr:hypothetical protein [Candidatus Uhrbacteria bacterium]
MDVLFHRMDVFRRFRLRTGAASIGRSHLGQAVRAEGRRWLCRLERLRFGSLRRKRMGPVRVRPGVHLHERHEGWHRDRRGLWRSGLLRLRGRQVLREPARLFEPRVRSGKVRIESELAGSHDTAGHERRSGSRERGFERGA